MHKTQGRKADFPALVTTKNRIIPNKNTSTAKKGKVRNNPKIGEKSEGRTTRTKANKEIARKSATSTRFVTYDKRGVMARSPKVDRTEN